MRDMRNNRLKKYERHEKQQAKNTFIWIIRARDNNGSEKTG